MGIVSVGDDEREQEAVRRLLQREKAEWPQAMSLGDGWYNPPFERYDMNYIPFSVLLDRHGRVIDTDVRGKSLDSAVAKALRNGLAQPALEPPRSP